MKLTKNSGIDLTVLLFFIVLSVVMLWPLAVEMADHLISPVDPLLNTWIFAWDTHQLFKDPFHLFDANIFFPLKNTLAFSEHMIVLSLIAFPVSLISGNPILGYNFIQFLAYILCGFAVYLLVFHLTKSRIAGILAGVIFAFSPYRFRQIGHIQNLTVFWIPLGLLYFHKSIKKPSWKNMGLFALFFILQVLTCSYMGVFFTIPLGIFVLYYLMFLPRANISPFFKKLLVSAILSGMIIAPFLVPYFQVKKEHRFERSLSSNIQFSANILGYATISRFNRNVFYEARSEKNRILINKMDPGQLMPVEKGLFPGILTILLAFLAFLLPPYPSKLQGEGSGVSRRLRSVEKLVNFLLFFLVGLAGIIVISRGLKFSIAGLKIELAHLTIPVNLIIFFLIVKLILSRFSLGNSEESAKLSFIHRNFYLFVGTVAFFLSLGPRMFYFTHDFGKGPYMALHNNVVFFKGIRAPGRLGIFVMLALSVLAGYGITKLLNMLKKRGRAVVSCFILAFLVYEFICVPLPYEAISRQPKEVYEWLASTEGEFGILEYPFQNPQTNKYYMYWSIHHWKDLAMGSSGFYPKIFNNLREIAHKRKSFPSEEFIQYVKDKVPVKYIILHLENFSDADKEKILENAENFSKDLKLVHVFEQNDYVYEVLY